MQVTAFNTPKDPSWRWRIVNYAGETIAESRERFPSIVAAVRHGAKRLIAMNVVDTSQPVNWRRSTSHLRASSSASRRPS
jgi:chemotaxis regulatin CheY-phosphate phosphatase CheZ